MKNEEERKSEAQAKLRIDSIVEQYTQGEKLRVFGIAYWDTTILGGTSDRVFKFALLGWAGSSLSGASHHAGILAVTETKLHVIETATILGDKVNAFDILGISYGKKSKPPIVKTTHLKNLRVVDRKTKPGRITITGAIEMEAKFPSSYETGNEAKSEQIAAAIRAARE